MSVVITTLVSVLVLLERCALSMRRVIEHSSIVRIYDDVLTSDGKSIVKGVETVVYRYVSLIKKSIILSFIAS